MKDRMKRGAVVVCSPSNVTNGTLSLLNAQEAFGKARLVSGPETTSSASFWREYFADIAAKASNIIVVGLRVDEEAIRQIEEANRNGIKVHVVTHAEPSGNILGYAWEAGAIVTVAPSRGWAFWGPWSARTLEWAKIGGAFSWDSKLFEDSPSLRVLASGLRFAIRKDFSRVSSRIIAGDFNFFRTKPHFPEIPTYERRGEVAVFDLLPDDPANRIHEAITRLRVGYGVGISRFRQKWEVIVCRNWGRRDLLPAALAFGLVNHRRQWSYYSNSGSVIYRFENLDQAIIGQDEIVQILNSPGPASFEQFNRQNYWKGTREMMLSTKWPWYMTDHNWTHVVRMLSPTVTLCGLLKRRRGELPRLSQVDDLIFELYAATHDVGHAKEGVSTDHARELHHAFSNQFVLENSRKFDGILSGSKSVGLLAELCLRHRSRMDLPEKLTDRFRVIIARIGDQADMDYARAQFNSLGEPYSTLKPRLPRTPVNEVEHFESCRAIRGVRFIGGFTEEGEQKLRIEIVCSNLEVAALQVARMEQEVDSLWEFLKVEVVAVSE